MELIMSTTLGENWRDNFDFVFAFCRKPVFFNTENPMHIVDKSKPTLLGEQVSEISEEMKGYYIMGNKNLLEQHLRKKTGKANVKIVFHGDQWVSDVHWSNSCESWDGIAVVEEFCAAPDYEPISDSGPYKTKCEAGLTAYTKYWGDDFFTQDGKRNYYVTQMSKNARYAVPLLRHVANFIDA